MYRMFSEHDIRKVISLDGVWNIVSPETGKRYYTSVPGVWNTIPELCAYNGIIHYMKSVYIPKSGAVLLRFGGISHTARVFWDGKLVGSHYNAFTGFEILLPLIEAGEHEIRAEVDNSFGEDSTLHIPNDYYTYGGINRSAEIQLLSGAIISSQSFYSTENADGSFEAHIKTKIKALSAADKLVYRVSIADKSNEATLTSLKAGEEREIETVLSGLHVTPWDVHAPKLYYMKGALISEGKAVDDLIDRVGFRTFEIDGERMLLNHKQIKILGFNRHEDHGQMGLSMDAGAMMCDLQLMLDMGANSVRTCHYPNDPKFLDLCDELGILVWEEHHARALPAEILRKPKFYEQISACNEEMITQHANHPSIYVWGILNECESETEFGHALYEKNFKQLRSLDPTRPVTFASCRHFKDICMDLVDIVSFNIYPLWYESEPIDAYLERFLKWMEESGAKNKPILISEIGAGAIPGYHDPFRRAKWSEERQCDIIAKQLDCVLSNQRISGAYIWQFADVKVAEEWAMHRPRTMNNKGIVDEYRRPKLSYFMVKQAFEKNR